jgi:protein involved in polysaccharide export with SLBB domain
LFSKTTKASMFLLLLCGAGLAQELGDRGEGGPIQNPETDLMFGETKKEAPPRNREKIQGNEAPPMFGVVDEASYIVGPGDIFYVAVGTQNFDTPVGPDGTVIVASFPPIPVNNKTLAEAKKILSDKLQRYYKAGGIYIALSGSRVSDVILSADGTSRQASHQITLRHASGKTEKFSLAGYYRDGDLSQNPYLAQGDQVFVTGIDYSQPIVYVQNEKGVRVVQLTNGDDLESVVSRASDFTKAKDWDHVNVYKDGKFREKVLRSNGRSFKPEGGTTLEVRATQLYVFVGGTVLSPGSIVYNPTFTILDYIAKAGITQNTGDSRRVVVLDAAGERRSVDAKTESPRPGDHIIVPRSYEAKARDYITIMVSLGSLAVAVVTFQALQ